jgi:flagellar biosynthesis protein FlhA
VVSKAGVEGSANKALTTQLAMNPVALGMVSASSGVIALIPACRSSRSPPWPWARASWPIAAPRRPRSRSRWIPPPWPPGRGPAEPEEEPISASLAIDDVKIELGYGLLTLINDLDGRR